MQHRQSGSQDPDESPAHDPSGGLPFAMASDDPGTRSGDMHAYPDDLDPAAVGGTSAGARLRTQRGSVDVIEVTLDRQVLVIGRRLTNDIVIHDTNVSRQHARLLRGPDGYAIEDTQSSNGTFVNDERVFGPRPLRTGDFIRIGDAEFLYEAASPSGAPSARAAGPAEWTRAVPESALLAPSELADVQAVADSPTAEGGADRLDAESLAGDPPAAEYAVATTSLSPDELHDELARRDASPAASAEAGPPGTVAEARPADATSATGAALADVGRDLAAMADTAARLADRVRALEAVVDARPRRAPEPGRTSSDDTVALVEFSRLLRDLQTFGDPEAATAAANLLDQLSRQPRDVELLLSISRQAPIMAVVLRQHAYLMRLAPLLDEALGRMLQ